MNGIRLLAMLGLAATAMGFTCPAAADENRNRTADERFELMQAEIERLRQDNQSMRSELDELRYATGDNWLTERRAEEIRGLVADVLADADTRASLLSDGLTAGWRDGFFLASPDGRFLLRIQGQMQFRYMYSYHDADPPFAGPGAEIDPAQLRHARGFEASRTRLAFRGHVFDRNLTYMVRGEFQRDRMLEPEGGGFFLRDAWMRYHLTDEWSIRAGQFKLPFSREFLVFSGHQLAVERSLIDTNLNIGRSQGVELTYADDMHRVTVAYSDGGTDNLGQFGFFATGPALTTPVPVQPPSNTAALRRGVEYALTARYEFLAAGTWRQFEDFTSPMGEDIAVMFGVAGHLQRDQATGQPPGTVRRHSRWFAYTVDGSAEFGGANLFASFTHHYVDSPGGIFNIFGVVAQGGFYLTPKWEMFARYEWGHWSGESPVAAGFQDPHLVTIGANYYLDGHDAKWTTDIGLGMTQIDQFWTRPEGGITAWRIDPAGAKPQVVFRTQFQLLF